MAHLPEKFKKLIATIPPTKRLHGRSYHRCVFVNAFRNKVPFVVMDGKHAVNISEEEISLLADLLYVFDIKNKPIVPKRPDTNIPCPKGHGCMQIMAAFDLTAQVVAVEDRIVTATFRTLDIPICPECGTSALPPDVCAVMREQLASVYDSPTVTTFSVREHKKERNVSVVRHTIGRNVQVCDPERDVTIFKSLSEAIKSIPEGCDEVPKQKNDAKGVVSVWLIETAKMAQFQNQG